MDSLRALLAVVCLATVAGCAAGPATDQGAPASATASAEPTPTQPSGAPSSSAPPPSPSPTPSAPSSQSPAPSPSPSASPSPSPSSPPPASSPPPPPPAPPPAPALNVGCDGAPLDAPRPTAGSDDARLPTLSWAVVKTGFRFVVAWESPQAGTGTLRVLVGDGAWENHTDPLSRRVHVFLIQFLPVGGVLCFQAFDATAGGTVSSHVHAVRLANAMNAYDPYAGTYSINLVTSANHLSNRAILEAGYRHFAEALWDATDGRVRAGHLIVLYNDFERPYVIVTGLGLAPARIWHDVIFQHDFPLYAGYTRRDGIADADEGFIVMNSLWEAPAYATSPTPALVHEVGHILLHELGHYAFGALDLYTDVDDCFEAATTISVMGGNLQATEFDDELRRCPNAASISGYVPTWTLLRERFPAVGARDGAIDPGPEGDGGAFQFRAYDVAAR